MTTTTSIDLQKAAKEHLWMHFTRMGGYETEDVPIIVRGEGCYLEDANGKRYLDALAGLFCVNIGYSFGEEVGQAALEQMRELPFYTNWSYAHPRAIELAEEVASLAPGDLNRCFFVSGRPADRGDGDHGARAERGRCVHTPRGVLAGRSGDLRPVRDPAVRGRGDHRLRSDRRLVRLGALRHPPRSDHVREGALVGVRVDRCCDRCRPRGRA